MKSSLRELQNNSFSAPAPVNTLAASNNLRMASVPQMISALREDDPAFDKVIATQRAERGQ
ncbi:MAG: hypothetical protein WAU00_21935, partial [Caldilinea sp.]